ncbi:hypothetical protein BH11MYX2_BH11MYX2_04120 [soil metagenome]
MAPTARLASVLVLALVACGAKHVAPKAPAEPISTDPDVQALAHTWIIDSHFLVKGSPITEKNAAEYDGRTLVISEEGYTSPFHPPCDHAAWKKSPRELSDLANELQLGDRAAANAAEAGLTSDLVEFRMTCTGRGKPPPVIVWLGGRVAMTCFGGACYMMKRFEE